MKEDISPEKSPSELHEYATWLDKFVIRIGWLLSWLFLIAVVISVFEIISRYVFSSPTGWVHETTIFLVAGCLLFGGAYCLATADHIRIGIVADAFTPKLKKVVNIINTMLIATFLGMLIHASYIMANKAWFSPSGAFRLETSGSAWNPPYPAILKAFLLFVVVIMFAQAVLHLVRAIARYRNAR